MAHLLRTRRAAQSPAGAAQPGWLPRNPAGSRATRLAPAQPGWRPRNPGRRPRNPGRRPRHQGDSGLPRPACAYGCYFSL